MVMEIAFHRFCAGRWEVELEDPAEGGILGSGR